MRYLLILLLAGCAAKTQQTDSGVLQMVCLGFCSATKVEHDNTSTKGDLNDEERDNIGRLLRKDESVTDNLLEGN
jgi:hypothetical protein